jgi:hypothetical protein
MIFYGTNAARGLRACLLASLALGLSMAGCTEDEPADTTEVGSTYEALAVQLQNCASNGLDCYQAANCDEAAEQVCRDEFRACREATRDAYRAYHRAIGNCFRAKLECVRDAWTDGGATTDGGEPDFSACRDEFHACIEVDRPIPAEPGPCMSGLRECVQANVQWGEDGSRAAFHDCLSEAHTCIQNRLPMCDLDGGTGGSVDGGV